MGLCSTFSTTLSYNGREEHREERLATFWTSTFGHEYHCFFAGQSLLEYQHTLWPLIDLNFAYVSSTSLIEDPSYLSQPFYLIFFYRPIYKVSPTPPNRSLSYAKTVSHGTGPLKRSFVSYLAWTVSTIHTSYAKAFLCCRLAPNNENAIKHMNRRFDSLQSHRFYSKNIPPKKYHILRIYSKPFISHLTPPCFSNKNERIKSPRKHAKRKRKRMGRH